MNSQVDWAAVSDVMANHLPALGVVAAAVLGASAVNALVPKPSEALPEIAPGITVVTPEVIREFPLEIGTVTRVIDGDTYDVQLDRTGDVVRVRLAWVDTPETNQPFGAEATQWAENRLQGRQVVLTAQDADTYGRLVAQLTVTEHWPPDPSADGTRIIVRKIRTRRSNPSSGSQSDIITDLDQLFAPPCYLNGQ